MGRVSSLARGPGLNPFFFPHRLECARRAVFAVRSPRRHNRRLAFPAMKPADQIKVLDAAVTAELSGTEVAMPGTSPELIELARQLREFLAAMHSEWLAHAVERGMPREQADQAFRGLMLTMLGRAGVH